MATHTFAPINLPQAERLADLTGIQRDLETAIEFAGRLIAHRESNDPDSTLLEALTVATVVRYCRAFVTGVRAPLTTDVLSALSEEQRITHEDIRAWRDKHIAHSVNSFEESTPVARYCRERVREEGVYGIECNHGTVITFHVATAYALVEIANALLKYVGEQVAAEKERLLVLVKAMPIDEILAAEGGGAFVAKGPVERARKRFSLR